MGASQSSSESLPGHRQRTRRGPLRNRPLGSDSSRHSDSNKDGPDSDRVSCDSSEDRPVSEQGLISSSDRGNNCWGGVGSKGSRGGIAGNNNCWGFSEPALPRSSDSPPTYRTSTRDSTLESRDAKVHGAGKGRSSSAISKHQSQASSDDRSSSSFKNPKGSVIVPVRASREPARSHDSSTVVANGSTNSNGHRIDDRRAEGQAHDSAGTTSIKVPAFMRRSQQAAGWTPSSSSSVDSRSVPMSSSHLEALQVIESLKSTLQSNKKPDAHEVHASSKHLEGAAYLSGSSASSQAGAGSHSDMALVPTPQPRRPRGTTPVRDAELAIAAVRRSMSQQRRLPTGNSNGGAQEGAAAATESSEERPKENTYNLALWNSSSTSQQSTWRPQSEDLAHYTSTGSNSSRTPALRQLSAEAEELRAQIEALELQCSTLEVEQRDAEAALQAKAAEEDELRASIERSSMFDVRTDIDEVRGASMDRVNAFSVDRPPPEAEARYTATSIEPVIVDSAADLSPSVSAFPIAKSTASDVTDIPSTASVATSSISQGIQVPRAFQRNFTWSGPPMGAQRNTSPRESTYPSLRDLLPSIPPSTSSSSAKSTSMATTAATSLTSVLASARASLRSTSQVDPRLLSRSSSITPPAAGTTTPPLPPPVGVRLLGEEPEEEDVGAPSERRVHSENTEIATNAASSNSNFASTEASSTAATPALTTTTKDNEQRSLHTSGTSFLSPGSPNAQKHEVDILSGSQPTPTTPPASAIDHDESIFSPPLSPTNVTRGTISDRTTERKRKAGRTPEINARSTVSPQRVALNATAVPSAFVRDAVKTKARVNGTPSTAPPTASPIPTSMAARLHAWKQSPVPEAVSRVEQMRKAFESVKTKVEAPQPWRQRGKIQRASADTAEEADSSAERSPSNHGLAAADEAAPHGSASKVLKGGIDEAFTSSVAVSAGQDSANSHSDEEVAALAAALECAYAVGQGNPWSGSIQQVTFGPGPIGITFSSLDTAPTTNLSAHVEENNKASGAQVYFQGREQMSSLNTEALALARAAGASVVVTDVGISTAAAKSDVQVGDLIVELNGQILAPGTHKDTFLELLTTAARPVVLGFKTAGTPEAPPAF